MKRSFTEQNGIPVRGLSDLYTHLLLMKLAAYHKTKGDSVEWYEPLFSGHMDRVYMSKVFSFTQDYEYFVDATEIIKVMFP